MPATDQGDVRPVADGVIAFGRINPTYTEESAVSMYGCSTLFVEKVYGDPTVRLCGQFGRTNKVTLCPACLEFWMESYPLGWIFTPGDLCEHESYVGPYQDEGECAFCTADARNGGK